MIAEAPTSHAIAEPSQSLGGIMPQQRAPCPGQPERQSRRGGEGRSQGRAALEAILADQPCRQGQHERVPVAYTDRSGPRRAFSAEARTQIVHRHGHRFKGTLAIVQAEKGVALGQPRPGLLAPRRTQQRLYGSAAAPSQGQQRPLDQPQIGRQRLAGDAGKQTGHALLAPAQAGHPRLQRQRPARRRRCRLAAARLLRAHQQIAAIQALRRARQRDTLLPPRRRDRQHLHSRGQKGGHHSAKGRGALLVQPRHVIEDHEIALAALPAKHLRDDAGVQVP